MHLSSVEYWSRYWDHWFLGEDDKAEEMAGHAVFSGFDELIAACHGTENDHALHNLYVSARTHAEEMEERLQAQMEERLQAQMRSLPMLTLAETEALLVHPLLDGCVKRVLSNKKGSHKWRIETWDKRVSPHAAELDDAKLVKYLTNQRGFEIICHNGQVKEIYVRHLLEFIQVRREVSSFFPQAGQKVYRIAKTP